MSKYTRVFYVADDGIFNAQVTTARLKAAGYSVVITYDAAPIKGVPVLKALSRRKVESNVLKSQLFTCAKQAVKAKLEKLEKRLSAHQKEAAEVQREIDAEIAEMNRLAWVLNQFSKPNKKAS